MQAHQHYTNYYTPLIRTHIHNRLMSLCLRLPGWAGNRRNIRPLPPILIIRHPSSTSSIYSNPWHPPCSICMLDSPFPQPLSTSFLVFLLVWDPLLHTPYISSPSLFFFLTHAHANAASFAVIPMLCHLCSSSEAFSSQTDGQTRIITSTTTLAV